MISMMIVMIFGTYTRSRRILLQKLMLWLELLIVIVIVKLQMLAQTRLLLRRRSHIHLWFLRLW